MMYHDGFGMLGLGFGFLIAIAILVFVVLAFVLVIRLLRNSHHSGKPVTGQAALNILDDRYAKGELSDEEYRLKKTELKK